MSSLSSSLRDKGVSNDTIKLFPFNFLRYRFDLTSCQTGTGEKLK